MSKLKTNIYLNLILCIAILFVFSINVFAQETTTIEWWVGSWKYEDGRAQRVVADFEEMNPNIKVQITPIAWQGMHEKELSSLIVRYGPDVMCFSASWAKEFANTGGLYDMTSTIDEIGRSNFYQAPLDWARKEGREYGIPYRTAAKCLVYNKNMFEQVGIPDPPKTWLELAEYAKKLTIGNVYGFSIPLNRNDTQSGTCFRAVLRSFGGDYVNPEETQATFNTEEAINALNYYKDLFLKDKVLPPDTFTLTNDDCRIRFGESLVAMIIEGPWVIPMADDANLSYDISLVPGIKENEPGTWDENGWLLGIPISSVKKEAAIKFIKFFLQPENDAYLTDGLPSVIEASKHPRFASPKMQVYLEQLDHSNPLISHSAAPAIYQAVTVGIQRIFLGENVLEVANEVNAEIQDLLDMI